MNTKGNSPFLCTEPAKSPSQTAAASTWHSLKLPQCFGGVCCADVTTLLLLFCGCTWYMFGSVNMPEQARISKFLRNFGWRYEGMV